MTSWARIQNERQAAGLCRVCAAPQAEGHALCQFHRDEQNARRMAKYKARLAAGSCVTDGCTRPHADGITRCGPCQRKWLAYLREYYKTTLKERRRKKAAPKK